MTDLEIIFEVRSRRKCELCSCVGTDVHEIIPASQAKRHFIPVEFRSFLCRDCNVKRADTHANRKILLRLNIKRYGHARVQSAWQTIVRTPKVYVSPRTLETIVEVLEETGHEVD